MRTERILLIGGIWIAVLPYLGFPYSWKNILFTLSGLGLLYVSYTLYREKRLSKPEDTTADNFSENFGFTETIIQEEETQNQ